MAGRNKWKNLMKKIPAKRREKIEAGAREDMAQMLLAEIRSMAGLTQSQVATTMGISQPSLSQLEWQKDMQISTLQRIVEALNGELEIIVKLPGCQVSLSQFKQTA